MTPHAPWQREERKLYLRDVVFILINILISLFLAEYFLLQDDATAVDRIFSYLIFFIPLGTVTVIAQYFYRNRRIRKTGNLRSSLRYRLSIAFLLIAVIPSIPIFLISSNNVETVVRGLFNRDVSSAMDAADRVIRQYEMQAMQDFLERLRAAHLLEMHNLPAHQILVRLQKSGAIHPLHGYAAHMIVENKTMRLKLMLAGKLKLDAIPEFKRAILPGLDCGYMRSRAADYVLCRYALKKGEYLLLGHRLHPGQESSLAYFKQMRQSLLSEEFFNQDVPTTLRLGLALVYIFMICMAFIIALVLARQIAGPIVSLAAATRAVADGDLDTRLDIKASGEIGILIDSFNQMTAELRTLRSRLFQSQRLAAWREVARRLAHEIKNPLTPIQLSADRMRRRLEHPEKGNLENVVKSGANTISEQVQVLRTLVEEFANFARLPKPILKPMNLEEILPEAVGVFQGVSGVSIELRMAGDLPDFPLDKTLIIGMINNLIKNAIEAIGQEEARSEELERASIIISTSFYQQALRKYVCLMVEDSGPGIDPGMRERVFEPYFSTKLNQHGTGLGLALVQRAVLEHDAQISVGTSDLGGAIFTILFRLRTY